MRGLLQLLRLAGFVQVAIAFANLFHPAKLKYRENLSRVAPIIRQIFVVPSVYIVGVVLLFAAVTFGFAGELASGHGLGRFLAIAIALFSLFRAPVQLLYYDATLCEENRWGDVAFTVGALFLAAIQKVIAWFAERTMKIPLLSLAQLRILSEGIVEALPPCDLLPADLTPVTKFTCAQIQNGLPEPGSFGLRDLRCTCT
jgi:hypothetical protein